MGFSFEAGEFSLSSVWVGVAKTKKDFLRLCAGRDVTVQKEPPTSNVKVKAEKERTETSPQRQSERKCLLTTLERKLRWIMHSQLITDGY